MTSERTTTSPLLIPMPICSDGYPNTFNGVFDGQGHSISGLYVNIDHNYAGLFGIVGADGVVKDLTVTGSVTGVDDAGGVVGSNKGKVQNVSFSGPGSGRSYVGGVVGQNAGGLVEFCRHTGEVSASGFEAGGIVGNNNNLAKIENCWHTGRSRPAARPAAWSD